ncbi:imidazole glycerol phosphate synthase subunit HisF [Fangia hongkongensis]|uniref:imidazole glycerol phosphate synthase subunit HisF n=1 Tax=Fangia hongkongensis TaxID=270495 RepID=UPI00035F1C8F|nr:imidazole glycerol phosphate synthase subunit HisF [Fangia hongkongensis]MBK2126385.1 imidazole glycerol phosphate synthase subunit HisF [Fangia hongkongensis]
MLAKRIIPCLDVKDGKVVKGVKFKNHRVIGDIVPLAKKYSDSGADELVFYDISASSDMCRVRTHWVSQIAENINIPFCVAGGIRTVEDAREILNAGADKISINSPALERADFINELVDCFGQQCVVVGIDSKEDKENKGHYQVYQYTGDEKKTIKTTKDPLIWAQEVAKRGAGEIVLNCMNQDGVKKGYAINHLNEIAQAVNIPVIASGGAGEIAHFYEVFTKSTVSGALAASVFHDELISISDLKENLVSNNIPIRACNG